jgi:hypothetical protein
MKHIIIINHICFYDCENLFRHLHKWSCQNDKPPDSEATCQRVRRYVRVVEHVHASIARSSARSLRIWLPGDSSADYHLDSIFIGAKIIVLLVIFTYITKLYIIYIYISLYKYRSFHIDICIYPPQKKKTSAGDIPSGFVSKWGTSDCHVDHSGLHPIQKHTERSYQISNPNMNLMSPSIFH